MININVLLMSLLFSLKVVFGCAAPEKGPPFSIRELNYHRKISLNS